MTESVVGKAAIQWPESWSDRGATRRFDDTKNYPAAGPGIIYARCIATLLDYPLERVLKYPMLEGPDGTKLPNWWQHDRYYSSYCTEAQAMAIVYRIRFHRNMLPHAKINPDVLPADHRAARARKLARLHKNSKAMLARFLVITPGHNAPFLAELGSTQTELGHMGVDVDTVLRAANIRPISLDNPERWTPGGYTVQPLKFQGLHPTDVREAMSALHRSIDAHLCPPPVVERAERATIVWLPRKPNGWQHTDPTLTTYPPGIRRIALKHDEPQGGWAKIRVFLEDDWVHVVGHYEDRDSEWPSLNGLVPELTQNVKKARFEGELTPEDVEEILL